MDLATDDPRTIAWTARVLTAANRQEEADAVEITRGELGHDLAVWIALALLRAEPQAVSGAGERAGTTLKRLRQLLRPWELEASPIDAVAKARDAWSAEFGDMDAPETQARIEATAAALERQMLEVEP